MVGSMFSFQDRRLYISSHSLELKFDLEHLKSDKISLKDPSKSVLQTYTYGYPRSLVDIGKDLGRGVKMTHLGVYVDVFSGLIIHLKFLFQTWKFQDGLQISFHFYVALLPWAT